MACPLQLPSLFRSCLNLLLKKGGQDTDQDQSPSLWSLWSLLSFVILNFLKPNNIINM